MAGDTTTSTTAMAALSSVDQHGTRHSNYSLFSPMPGTGTKYRTAEADFDFEPRVQQDATAVDDRMDILRGTVAAVTPDKNDALPSTDTAKPKIAALSVSRDDTLQVAPLPVAAVAKQDVSRDPLLEKGGSNLPPSTTTAVTSDYSAAVVSPDGAHKVAVSPIMATPLSKNKMSLSSPSPSMATPKNNLSLSSPISPYSPQEDSFWESNSETVAGHSQLGDDSYTSPGSILTEQSDLELKTKPVQLDTVKEAKEPRRLPVDTAISTMSTEEFLRMAEESTLGRYEYKSECSSNESESNAARASLLLAEEVEAQVKDVLSKYRGYGDAHIAGAKSATCEGADAPDDQPPRIISPGRKSSAYN
jgi:hypothetical protein